MVKNKIIIGRAYDCDIRIDQKFNMVSNHHAVILVGSDNIRFEDTSTNGSTVNGILVQRRAVFINPMDKIILSNQYVLSWHLLEQFLPIYNKATTIDRQSPNYTQQSDIQLHPLSVKYQEYCQDLQNNSRLENISSDITPHKPNNNMVWAILCTLFCCVPIGVYSIYCAAQVDSCYRRREYEDAQRYANKAKQLAIVSTILGVILGFIYTLIIMAAEK